MKRVKKETPIKKSSPEIDKAIDKFGDDANKGRSKKVQKKNVKDSPGIGLKFSSEEWSLLTKLSNKTKRSKNNLIRYGIIKLAEEEGIK